MISKTKFTLYYKIMNTMNALRTRRTHSFASLFRLCCSLLKNKKLLAHIHSLTYTYSLAYTHSHTRPSCVTFVLECRTLSSLEDVSSLEDDFLNCGSLSQTYFPHFLFARIHLLQFLTIFCIIAFASGIQ